MKRALFWIVTVVVALMAGSFALSNRMPVALALWPFPGTVKAPLFLSLLVTLLLGFLLGRFFAWLAYGTLRSAHRQRGRELAKLRDMPRPPAVIS